MKVVHLYDGHEQVYRGRGSVPGVVWNVARETAGAGHDVTVIERQWDGLLGREERRGVTIKRVNLPTGADEPWERVPYEMVRSKAGILRLVGDRSLFGVRALLTLLTTEFDVLHVHLPFAANVALTVAPWLRERTVYTAHLGELRLNAIDGNTDSGTAAADGGVEVPSILEFVSPDRYLASRAARTTVLNPGIRRALVAEGVPGSKLSVVPNGVDFDRFAMQDPTSVERLAETYDLTGATVLLFVGTVMPRKGVLDLVRAFGDVSADDEDVILVVAGEDELDEAYAARVREVAHDENCRADVWFTGFVPADDLPRLYALADVFVVPSLEEGFGMTAVEAMAAETPVVATRVGGIDRVIDDGRTGVIVDPGDVRALAGAMSRLVASPAERARMGDRAQDRARRFSWERVTRQYLDVYEAVGR